MSVDHRTYFQKSYKLLIDFQWIFKSSNTKYIADGILDHIPAEWVSCLTTLTNEELNKLPFGYINNDWPLSLKQFLFRLNDLQPVITMNSIDESYTKKINGVGPKKLHEISKLSAEIHNNIICETGETMRVKTILVDLGCGLGYLSQILNERYGYKVLGIESDGDRVTSAKQRQLKHFPSSVGQVHYVQHFVHSEVSIEFIRAELVRCFSPDSNVRFALIGLHACGDLTISALQLFLNMTDVQSITIMPCCYHKMQFCVGGDGFENIPLSATMRNSNDWDNVLGRPFLRLASQQTAARWRILTAHEHDGHGRNMFRRAIVQAALLDGERVEKQKRATTESDNTEDWHSEYQIYDVATNSKVSWTSIHIHRLKTFIINNRDGEKLSEFLTGLQAAIQSICEYVVLLDKVSYVKESSKSKVLLKKIMREELSPRCYVLMCNKDS